MARDLARARIELTSLVNAGCWRTATMPAHYRGLKLLRLAAASISVPSTVKCSSDSRLPLDLLPSILQRQEPV